MVLGEAMVPERSKWTTAWLSQWKTTCLPAHDSPQRRRASRMAYASLNWMSLERWRPGMAREYQPVPHQPPMPSVPDASV